MKFKLIEDMTLSELRAIVNDALRVASHASDAGHPQSVNNWPSMKAVRLPAPNKPLTWGDVPRVSGLKVRVKWSGQQVTGRTEFPQRSCRVGVDPALGLRDAAGTMWIPFTTDPVEYL